jgi:GNAT superfamily N-acetyltransferase
MTKTLARDEGLKVVFEPYNDAAKQFVTDKLGNYNIAVTGHAAYYPVAYFLRTADGELLGGLHGAIWGQWLHVKILWIAEPVRGKGHAREMLLAAEEYAVARGCIGAQLETFSFQALPLYEKLGYEVFGEIKDYPPGHVFYFLRKTLGAEVR